MGANRSVDYLMSLGLAAPTPDPRCEVGTEAEERRWSSSRTGPPNPPPLVRLSTPFLQQVALFHRSLR